MEKQKKRSLILGVDPGIHGALALYDCEKKALTQVLDMPFTVNRSGKNQVDPYALTNWLSGHSVNVALAIIEQVGAMPNQGVVSTFNFGRSTGVVVGVVGSFHIPIHETPAAIWKTFFGLTHNKDLSREKAMAAFPYARHWFLQKKHDGRAEAAFLAKLGERLVDVL